MRAWRALLLVVLAVSLPGCASFVGADQPVADERNTLLLQPGETLGQTFVARWAGLEGAEFFLLPDTASAGEIILHLRADPQATGDLTSARLPLSSITAPAFYRFAFEPQPDSRQRYYFAFLEIVGTGSLKIGSAAGEAYLDGAAYQKGDPLDAQLAFRLTYQPKLAWQGAGQQLAAWIGITGISILLFVLPGWALLLLLGPRLPPLPWPVQLGLAIGLSLALYPILFLWTDLIGLHLGPLYAWLPLIGGLTFMVWRMSKAAVTRRREVRLWPGLRITFQSWLRSQNFWPDLALLVVTGLTFATRFWAIRSLDVPLWGDSYHHTLIAQLLVDHGGLFDSWQPYAELQTFTYHFGFHALAAVLHWITQWALPSAILWTGQILNGLAALALYPLAFRLSGNRWGGVGAVLVAGLLAPMPMAYINWGRYTQLAGQAILPAAMWLTWVAIESGRRPRRNWGLIALVWLASAGVALSHYRVLIFYLGFVLVLTAGLIVRTRDWRRVIARVMAVGGGATILFLPWFVHVFAGQIFLILGAQLATPPGEASAWTAQNGVGALDFYLSPWLWLLLLLGLAWGLWRRQMNVALIGLWWLLVLLSANPGRLGLPGAGAVNNFAVLIAAYIPAGILVGAALGWLMNAHGCAARARGVALAVCLLLIGVGAWGAQQRLGDVGISESALVTIPDQRAAEWIRANTPPGARFLTNAFFAYSGTLVVGSDAGWWLPLLAGRSTALPPINYGTEQGPRPDYREWVNQLSARVFEKGLDDSETLALLRERGIKYIYIGQRQGKVNNPGPTLEPEQLLVSAYFEPVYHQDRVWVFALNGR